MNRVASYVEKYPCGPGGHDFEPTGVRMSPVAHTPPLNSASMESVTMCRACGKSGWERTPTCEVRESFGGDVSVLSARTLTHTDGRRLAGLPLCSECHIGLLNGDAPDWTLEVASAVAP